MADLVVEPSAGLRGEILPPADKSIIHRALIFCSIAGGPSAIEYPFDGKDKAFVGLGADNLSTLKAMQSLGAKIDYLGSGKIAVSGINIDGLREPADVIDSGNSGTTMRLLAGLLAGQNFFSVITGDKSLRSRPMARVITPLKKMGADIRGRENAKLAPLAIRGKKLKGIEYKMPVASAQVKSCLLLAGLYAEGKTTVIEPGPSRNHTELMLASLGAKIKWKRGQVTLTPGAALVGGEFLIPSDISAAAFWIVAALITPGSELLIRNVGLNPTRDGILQALWKMGGDIEIIDRRKCGEEQVGDLRVKSSKLCGVTIGGDLIPRMIDEAPALAVAAAFAEGTTEITDAAELRVKESDRLATTAAGLLALGAKVEQKKDGLVIEGREKLSGGVVKSAGDHRIAMAFAIAGFAASAPVTIKGAQSAGISYPGFADTIERVASKKRRKK